MDVFETNVKKGEKMGIKTKDELLTVLNDMIGDDTSDSTIAFIEDVTDTFDDFEKRIGEDWKAKYEQLDEEWKKKYKERFFKTPEEKHVEYEIKTFDDLFEEVK